jgi:carboxylesterase
LPGHGDSLINFSKVHSADWITEVETVCSQLVNEYKRVDVLGLSLGGLLACHLSQRFNLNRLYLLAPALVLKLNLPLTLFFAHLTYCCGLRVLPNPSAGNIHANHHAELTYRKLSVIMSIRILTFIRDFNFIAPQCPTELFLGRFDGVVNSVKVAEKFVNLPQANIHWLENSAHILTLDGDVDVILDVIRKA